MQNFLLKEKYEGKRKEKRKINFLTCFSSQVPQKKGRRCSNKLNFPFILPCNNNRTIRKCC